MDTKRVDDDQLLTLTAAIAAAHVSRNQVTINEVAMLVRGVFGALAGLRQDEEGLGQVKKIPAVSVRASVKPDYLTCLVCGSKQKTLKRHLHSAHNLTARQYRDEFNLPIDYPMVSADYSRRRSEMAQAFGLGRKAGKPAASAKRKA